MPGYWPEMQSPAPEIMGGDSKAQMELLADYVLSLGQGGLGTKPESEMKPVSIQNQSAGMSLRTANSK
jgi:hypothetical protein